MRHIFVRREYPHLQLSAGEVSMTQVAQLTTYVKADSVILILLGYKGRYSAKSMVCTWLDLHIDQLM
jgi:hypothetical protein